MHRGKPELPASSFCPVGVCGCGIGLAKELEMKLSRAGSVKNRFTTLTAVLALVVACLMLFLPAVSAYAYYSLPGVSISLSQSAVSVQGGQSQTISVAVSPLQESQLPGCGMAECPQACGPDCLDPNGWCVCAGTTYQTYYTQVSVSSSNNAVAQASYSAGTLSITGVAAGSATITISASLAKHVDSAAYVSVTVTAAPKEGGITKPPKKTNKPPKDNKPDTSNRNSSGGTNTTAPSTGTDTEKSTKKAVDIKDAAGEEPTTSKIEVHAEDPPTHAPLVPMASPGAPDTSLGADEARDGEGISSQQVLIAATASVVVVLAAVFALRALQKKRRAALETDELDRDPKGFDTDD